MTAKNRPTIIILHVPDIPASSGEETATNPTNTASTIGILTYRFLNNDHIWILSFSESSRILSFLR